ncbi:MAG TPA: flavodoxin domain-containing protein [Acidimicrobiia bacterium]|nr:flavodoxin domain-containing protein [Acidimicrobiia bacterium]
MRILITYGSKRGGTAEIAHTLGRTLESEGFDVDVRAATRSLDPMPYDAVIVGGALYASRWHRAARRFVRRRGRSLHHRPVWFFSSGPLDDSAAEHEIPATKQVTGLMAIADAREHRTFGGRLAQDASGFPAAAMVRNGKAGDWRDADRIRAWARDIAAALHGSAVGTAEVS